MDVYHYLGCVNIGNDVRPASNSRAVLERYHCDPAESLDGVPP